ncbi:MAG: fibronectin type III domain-containing protein, partial [Thermoplasmatota archaeon]
GNVALGWGPPENDWGVPLLGYNIYRGTSPEEQTLIKTLGPATFTYRDSTANGIRYYYTATAVNVHGESDTTDPVEALPTGIPGMVMNGSASIGDSSVSLRWGDPVHDGGLPITAFKVYRGLTLDTIDMEFLLSSDAHSYLDTDLQNGVTYYYRITALNAKGEGAPSSAVIATPGKVPDRIGDLKATGGLENVILTWENPGDLGGREGLNIRIHRGNTIASMRPYETLPYGTDHYKDTSVKPGLIYYYSLSAVNQIGEGARSLIVSTVVYGAPSPPEMVQANLGSKQVNISWMAPDDTGGLPITGYKAQIRPEGETEWESHPTNDNFYLFTALIPGQTYAFQVRAVNSIAEGDESRTIKVLVGDPPEEPRELKVVSLESGSAVRISWTPRPLTSMPILAYRIYMGMYGTEPALVAQVESTVETYTLSGLLNGIQYNFSVSGVNQIGEGRRTEEEVAIPLSVPGSVDVIWVDMVSDRTVKFSWAPPLDNGGSPILDYTIRRGLSQGAEVNIKEGITSTTYLDTDVDNGRTYYYKVVAVNIMGSSRPGEWISARPVGTPSPPKGFDYTAESDRVKLEWEPPENNGGDPVTGYLLYRSEGSGETELFAVLAPDITSYTDRSVEEGSYSYRLIATNPNGMGEASVMNIDVPGRTNEVVFVSVVALLIPLIISLMVLFLPGFLAKRRERREKRRKEIEEEELNIRRMRAEGLASKGAAPALSGMAHIRPALAAPTHAPEVGRKPETPVADAAADSGYIRPSDMKKKTKKDRAKVLRSDGKSLEHREKEEERRHTLAGKDHDKGKEWEQEKKRILEEEARSVFTGQQIHEEEGKPVKAPTPVEPPEDLDLDVGPVPTVEEVLKEMPEWDEDREEEEIPDWGGEDYQEEIPLADVPPEPVDIDEIDEVEEMDDLEELDELDEVDEFEE